MKYRLSGHRTHIHADIETLDPGVRRQDVAANLPQQVVTREKLFRSQLEVILRMALGYHQGVALRNGETVPDSESKLILGDDPRHLRHAPGQSPPPDPRLMG